MIEAKLTDAKLARTRRNLERLAGELTNPVQANKAAATAIYGWTMRNYDAEGVHQKPRWPALAERTVKRKARKGKEKMLVMSGHMRASILPFWSKDNAGVGSEVEYAAHHEEGRKHLPQRKILPTERVVAETGLKVYGYYVSEAVKRANV